MLEHGGDIYRNKVNTDLSVNISPYGVPPMVRAAINSAVLEVSNYPDPLYEELRGAIATAEGVSADEIVCGNGASELIYAVARVLAAKIKGAKKASILVPCYSEYKKAFLAAGFDDVKQVCLDEKKGFLPDENALNELLKDTSAIMIGNPNNPTGRVLPKQWLSKLVSHAEEMGIYVILDESFIELTEHEEDYKDIKSQYLIRIRAYTKSMAIPGVRLGFLMCENKTIVSETRALLPDWNVSLIAAKAGVAASFAKGWLREKVFDEKTGIRALAVSTSKELRGDGLKVFDTDTNFVLVKCEDASKDLYENMLKQGILIRDCSNFEGLEKGFYRIAVRFEQKNRLLSVEPSEIEKTSFEILTGELEAKGVYLSGDTAPVIKRCIHTTADFEYASTLSFSENAVSIAKKLIREGAYIVTDTNMALSGINKKELAKYGGQAMCFMADEEIARLAKERGSTRASVSMEHATTLGKKIIFAVGNAPTALVTLCEMMDEGRFTPDFVIGVPVGFVNVEQAKDMVIERNISHIVNRGRKGGSNVAAAIVNAILYSMRDE